MKRLTVVVLALLTLLFLVNNVNSQIGNIISLPKGEYLIFVGNQDKDMVDQGFLSWSTVEAHPNWVSNNWLYWDVQNSYTSKIITSTSSISVGVTAMTVSTTKSRTICNIPEVLLETDGRQYSATLQSGIMVDLECLPKNVIKVPGIITGTKLAIFENTTLINSEGVKINASVYTQAGQFLFLQNENEETEATLTPITSGFVVNLRGNFIKKPLIVIYAKNKKIIAKIEDKMATINWTEQYRVVLPEIHIGY